MEDTERKKDVYQRRKKHNCTMRTSEQHKKNNASAQENEKTRHKIKVKKTEIIIKHYT
jgi:hypothetical protein